MSEQLEIPVEIYRGQGDNYGEALAEYLKANKPAGHRIFLCFCSTKKQYFVNWLFTKEFLEYRKVKIIQ